MAKRIRTNSSIPELKLLTDQALGEGLGSRPDGLGFEAYASVLSRAAIGTPGPFTIGIFGEWGTGKTSLMRLIQTKLASDDVVTVWFNAWQYEKEDNPIVPLVGTILQEIERNKGFRDKLADHGKGLLRSLRAIVYGFSASTEIAVPGFAKVEAGFVVKDMVDRESALAPDPLIERSLYYHAFETLASVPLPTEARVVVLIDDLDRCFPDTAIRLLENIKLVLAQRGFIFILGVARTVLEGYLQHRYETKYGIEGFQGGAYLDKIVQLAFPIPSHTGRMDELAQKLIGALDTPRAAALKDVVPLVAEYLGANPRALVRFVNNLLIDVEIAQLTLEEHVPLSFFAITRCLQLRWRSFYDCVVLDRPAADFAASWNGDSASTDAALHGDVVSTLAGDTDLLRLVRSTPCKQWLEDHDMRERAVLFLKKTFRDTNPAMLSKHEPAVALVTGESSEPAELLTDALRSAERSYSSNHYTYKAANSLDQITAMIDRETGHKPILIFIGDPSNASSLFQNLRSMYPGIVIHSLSTSATDTRTAAAHAAHGLLRALYGTPSQADRRTQREHNFESETR